jgi:hypothetical protein
MRFNLPIEPPQLAKRGCAVALGALGIGPGRGAFWRCARALWAGCGSPMNRCAAVLVSLNSRARASLIRAAMSSGDTRSLGTRCVVTVCFVPRGDMGRENKRADTGK